MPEAVLLARGIEKSYTEAKGFLPVLKGVDLEASQGETLAVVGASGSGKSTLLQILGGLDLPDRGEVFLFGESLPKMKEGERAKVRNRLLGFIYQFHHLLFEFTALENVAMPLFIRRAPTRASLDKARAILEAVGLGERLGHFPSELSGGERQRVAVARALVTDPLCILADEPTGDLDPATAQEIFSLFLRLAREKGVTLVVATHDLDAAKRLSQALFLEGGRLVKKEAGKKPSA